MVRLYTPTEEIATLEEAPKNIGVKVGLSTQSGMRVWLVSSQGDGKSIAFPHRADGG